MITAAEAIPNNLTAEDIYMKSRRVIEGLKAHGVNVVSYSCDGTEVERSVQDLLVTRSTNWSTRTVPDPKDDYKHEIRIPMYHLSPIVMIQDSKHAAKTLRNNLFSGARALVLGNHLAMYSYVRDICLINDYASLFPMRTSFFCSILLILPTTHFISVVGLLITLTLVDAFVFYLL